MSSSITVTARIQSEPQKDGSKLHTVLVSSNGIYKAASRRTRAEALAICVEYVREFVERPR